MHRSDGGSRTGLGPVTWRVVRWGSSVATAPMPTALLHGSTSRSQQPPPHLNSCDADGGRASQLHHLVQDPDSDGHLGPPTAVLAKAQPVADHLLVAPDGGLDPAAFVVARHLLPPDPAVLGDTLEMAVALSGFDYQPSR